VPARGADRINEPFPFEKAQAGVGDVQVAAVDLSDDGAYSLYRKQLGFLPGFHASSSLINLQQSAEQTACDIRTHTWTRLDFQAESDLGYPTLTPVKHFLLD
jgi:hypothetical protein